MKIPTYKECLEMVERNPKYFVHKKESVGYYDISTFFYDYGMVNYHAFQRPIFERHDLDGHEMRGICFYKENEIYSRNLMLRKFWQLDGNAWTSMDAVKSWEPIEAAEKIDGTLIRFVKLDIWRAKTIRTFFGPHTELANKYLIENKNYFKFIEECEKENLFPLFELVSPEQPVVIIYPETKLYCIALRDNRTGFTYSPVNHLTKKYNIAVPEIRFLNFTLQDLIEERMTLQGKEGWVVTFSNGKKLKIKSIWYEDLHKELT